MRPWRLARRQRVEMEAALAALRHETLTRMRDLRACDAISVAAAAMGARGHLSVSWRILRARVALALRAALRADEDARCEEARARCLEADAEWLDSEIAIHAMREWPGSERPMDVRADDLAIMFGPWPRALWEVTR